MKIYKLFKGKNMVYEQGKNMFSNENKIMGVLFDMFSRV